MNRATYPVVVSLSALLCGVGCGSSSGTGKSNGPGPSHPEPTNPIDVTAMPTSVDASCATALKGPHADALPVPADIRVLAEDYSVRLQWGGDLTPDGVEDDEVEGYRVCWGAKGEDPKHGVLSTHRVTQIFGVNQGQTYTAYVQSVDGLGNASAPAQVEFQADPSRVAALRQKLTGFFDDFNTPDGPLNELNWNTAYSFCNDPVANGTFVVDTHARNHVGNDSHLPGGRGGCDRNQNISRARAIFDFKNREGVISFDFDGSEGDRSTWYVSVFPYDDKPSDLLDISGHITFDPGPGHPGRFLRFSQSGNGLMINKYDDKGNPGQVYKADFGFSHPNIQTVTGVMRHWELRVSKSSASISIDGVKLLEAPDLGLDFERGIVTWDQFAYNPAKVGRPWMAFIFDNFGFDGPRIAPAVHNYKTQLFGNDFVSLGYTNPEGNPDLELTLDIPDPVENATKARFFYTVQNDYRAGADDSFSINGSSYPMPLPVSPTGITQGLIGDYNPFVVVTEIQPGQVVKGANLLTFHAEQSRLHNIHLELEFPEGKAPKYTQPVAILKQPAMPDLPLIGPTTIVGKINDKVNEIWSDKAFTLVPTDVSGTISVSLKVDNLRPVTASGRNLGVSRVELLIDKVVVDFKETQAASPAPSAAELKFELDTTKLANGAHELYGIAYDSAGTKGRPGYPGPDGVSPEDYTPVIINVRN